MTDASQAMIHQKTRSMLMNPPTVPVGSLWLSLREWGPEGFRSEKGLTETPLLYQTRLLMLEARHPH